MLLGVRVEGTDLYHLGRELIAAVPRWNMASLAIGSVALAALVALRRLPALPGALIVLGAGIAGSALFGPAGGVARVGTIDTALGWPGLPVFGWTEASRLAQYTLPLVLILFAESWGTIRALGLRHGEALEPNRELGALGVANFASALVQGMPVGAGFSAGAASESAGAASRMTAVIAALGLAALILFGGPLIALLPQPVLAAVVIAALTHALDPAPLVRLWRIGRDQYVALGATLAVIALGVLDGMLVAILLSIAVLVRRLATPRLTRLGRLGDSHDYVDIERHPDAIIPRGIAIWRPAAPLFFANADAILDEIVRRSAENPKPSADRPQPRGERRSRQHQPGCAGRIRRDDASGGNPGATRPRP